MTTATHRRWTEVLDDLEAELDEVESAALSELGAAKPFVPPTGIGPLPHELADRARQVLARIEITSERVARARDDARSAAGAAGRMSNRGPAPAGAVDFRC